MLAWHLKHLRRENITNKEVEEEDSWDNAPSFVSEYKL